MDHFLDTKTDIKFLRLSVLSLALGIVFVACSQNLTVGGNKTSSDAVAPAGNDEEGAESPDGGGATSISDAGRGASGRRPASPEALLAARGSATSMTFEGIWQGPDSGRDGSDFNPFSRSYFGPEDMLVAMSCGSEILGSWTKYAVTKSGNSIHVVLPAPLVLESRARVLDGPSNTMVPLCKLSVRAKFDLSLSSLPYGPSLSAGDQAMDFMIEFTPENGPTNVSQTWWSKLSD